MDGTFNTNSRRLPLICLVGITNTNTTFPVAFSYCPAEDKESFIFVLESLILDVFDDSTADPAVIMADQIAGLISALPKVMPGVILQSCDWHCVEAMKRKYRKSSPYNSKFIDDHLTSLSWNYVKSATLDELNLNRSHLLSSLHPDDKAYIEDFWADKEERVIYYHIKKNRNLGCTSSQRVESWHPLVHQVCNG